MQSQSGGMGTSREVEGSDNLNPIIFIVSPENNPMKQTNTTLYEEHYSYVVYLLYSFLSSECNICKQAFCSFTAFPGMPGMNGRPHFRAKRSFFPGGGFSQFFDSIKAFKVNISYEIC